jgi:hypothetical protein
MKKIIKGHGMFPNIEYDTVTELRPAIRRQLEDSIVKLKLMAATDPDVKVEVGEFYLDRDLTLFYTMSGIGKNGRPLKKRVEVKYE